MLNTKQGNSTRRDLPRRTTGSFGDSGAYTVKHALPVVRKGLLLGQDKHVQAGEDLLVRA